MTEISGVLCRALCYDVATSVHHLWIELLSRTLICMSVELQPAHLVAVRLLSSSFRNSEKKVQLCQADACMVFDGFGEWGFVAASFLFSIQQRAIKIFLCLCLL